MGQDDYTTAKTSVWWDIENCQVPRACDPHLVAQNISSALAEKGYRGVVSISAFGDTSKIPQAVQKALNSTGVALNHVPAGVKDASDKKILVGMFLWAVDNPPPANYLLISGDCDFSDALHQLSFRRYNILLAQPAKVSRALVAAAKNVWNWSDLVAGGHPLSVSPYIGNTVGSSSNEVTNNAIIADIVLMMQSDGPPAVHLDNKKTCYTNGKVDYPPQWKQKNISDPIQAKSDVTTARDEFKQSPVSNGYISNTVGSSSNEATDNVSVADIVQMTQSDGPPAVHLDNKKIRCTNEKVDNGPQWKQKNILDPIQVKSVATTASNEFKQPTVSNGYISNTGDSSSNEAMDNGSIGDIVQMMQSDGPPAVHLDNKKTCEKVDNRPQWKQKNISDPIQVKSVVTTASNEFKQPTVSTGYISNTVDSSSNEAMDNGSIAEIEIVQMMKSDGPPAVHLDNQKTREKVDNRPQWKQKNISDPIQVKSVATTASNEFKQPTVNNGYISNTMDSSSNEAMDGSIADIVQMMQSDGPPAVHLDNKKTREKVDNLPQWKQKNISDPIQVKCVVTTASNEFKQPTVSNGYISNTVDSSSNEAMDNGSIVDIVQMFQSDGPPAVHLDNKKTREKVDNRPQWKQKNISDPIQVKSVATTASNEFKQPTVSNGYISNTADSSSNEAMDNGSIADIVQMMQSDCPPVVHLDDKKSHQKVDNRSQWKQKNILDPIQVKSVVTTASNGFKQPTVSNGYISNTVDSSSNEVMDNDSIADIVQMMQYDGPPAVHLDNKKTRYTNEKVDNRPQWKQKDISDPIPVKSVVTTACYEFKHPPVSNGPLTHAIPQFKSSKKNPDEVSTLMMLKTKSQGNSQSNHTISSFPQSSPQKPLSEACSSYQSQAMISKEALHEFFQASCLNSVADYGAPHSVTSSEDGQEIANNFNLHLPQLLRPNDLRPPQPDFRSGNSSLPYSQTSNFYATTNRHIGPPHSSSQSWTNCPPFTPVPPVNLPETSKVSISDISSSSNSSSFKNYTKPNTSSGPERKNSQSVQYEHTHRPLYISVTDYSMSKAKVWNNPGCPVLSVEIQNILRALNILKADKMIPTEANIADCIRYGEMNVQNFNIKLALHSAIQRQLVVMHKLGGNLPLYVERNDVLWKCVNPMDINTKYPKATWNAVLKFISSTVGRNSIMTSQCRYQAAIVLRKSCLNHLVLGEVLQILYAMVNIKKWIVPHPSGWRPLSFKLLEADKSAVASPSTKFSHVPTFE